MKKLFLMWCTISFFNLIVLTKNRNDGEKMRILIRTHFIKMKKGMKRNKVKEMEDTSKTY